MRNYNFSRLLTAVLFTFLTGFGTTLKALPQAVSAATNGFIQYTQPVLHCDANGSCRPRPTWRDSQQTANVDGQRVNISTTDLMPQPFSVTSQKRPVPRQEPGPSTLPSAQRLKFSVSAVPAVAPLTTAKTGGNGQGIETLPPLKLDIHPSSDAYEEFMKIAPAVGSGALNAVQDLQASAAVASRLQEGYQRSLDGFRTANDHLVKGAEIQQQMNEQISNRFRVLAAAAMAAPQTAPTQNKDYQEYLAAAQDPFSFREYELIGTTGSEVLAAAKTAMQNRQPRKATQLANSLLHQKDSDLRAEANRDLSQGFNDGVLRSQVFGPPTVSILDGAHFKTPQHSPAGEIVRYLANKAQTAWIDTQALTTMTEEQGSAYFAALVALRASDEAFMGKDAGSAMYLAKVTDNLLDYATGLLTGTVKGLSGTVKSLPAVAVAVAEFSAEGFKESLTDPLAVQKQLVKFAFALPGVVETLAVHYWALGKQVAHGTYHEKGEAVGQIASEVLIAFITDGLGTAVKGATTVARATKIAEIAGQFGEAAVTPVLELTSKMGPPRVKALASMAMVDRPLAVQVVKAAQTLPEAGAVESYLNVVLGSGKPVIETVKSVSTVTEAVNNGVIRTSEHLSFAKGLQGALDQAPHPLTIRYVGDNGKVIVVGRSMESNVIPVEKILRKNGVASEVFRLSEEAKKEWQTWTVEFPHSDVPAEVQKSGRGYMENAKWLQTKIEEGYTIIDAGNPMKAPPSLYYDMEDEIIKRALESAKARGLE